MHERLFELPPAKEQSPEIDELTLAGLWAQQETADPLRDEALEVVINHERVEQVLGTLLHAYEQCEFPYNLDRVRLPHDPRHMPPSLERGSVDHAMFLFTSCYYMRGGEKSVNAFIKLSSMYESRPDLFRCEVAARTEEEEIKSVLKQHGLGMHKIVPRQWRENARRMITHYGGDPRNIFEGIDSYEESLERIQSSQRDTKAGFIGFQEKMTSMIIYYLMDEGLIKSFNFPIPVDMHVMRVSIANELITFPNAPDKTELFTNEVRATLRKLYFDYAKEHDVDPLRLCDAVWLLSESLCGRYPGNVTLEPLGRDNRNGRGTLLIPQIVNIHDSKQQAAYEASCRNCPIENSCVHAVPGKPTYVAGSIYIRGRKIKFPLSPQTSFLLEVHE